MSLLAETSPLKTLGKRLYEHGTHCSLQFSPELKRPKAYAFRQFPKNCGGVARKTSDTESKGFTGGDFSKLPTVVGEFVPMVSDPLKALVLVNLTSESSLGKLDYDDQVNKLKNADENKLEVPKKIDSEIMEANNVQPEATADMGTLDVSSFKPPPHSSKISIIRQRVSAVRQFPPNCGRQNYASFSEAMVLSDKVSRREPNPSKEMVKNCDESVRDENLDLCGIDLNNNEDVSDGSIAYVAEAEKGELVQRKSSTEVEQEEDEEQGRLVSLSELYSSTEVVQRESSTEVEQEEDQEQGRLVSLSKLYSLEFNSMSRKVSSKEDANDGHKGHIVELIDAGKSKLEFLSEDNEHSVSEDSLATSTDNQSLPMVVYNNNEEVEDLLKCKELDDMCILAYEECIAVNYCDKVREACKLFDELYAELLQKHKASPKGLQRTKCQIPVEAAQILKKQQKWLNKEKEFGHVRGVKIGDSFRFRAELAVVGLHHQYISGIDYVRIGKNEYATSIVDSDRYENESRSDEILIYLGQGGNAKLKVDQKLEGPNLALLNSMNEGRPVRVICKSKKSRLYIYNGLYSVMNCTQEREQHGKLVYKFELHRIKGQPEVMYVSGLTQKELITHRDNCVVSDLSQGKEKVPIRAINAIDNEKPPPFTYMATMVYPNWYHPPVTTGCNCVNGCSDHELCSCAAMNGGEIPFNNKASIIRAKPIVYECGPSCKCAMTCNNRVSQHGPSYSLEVFKTQSRGWGVRSRNLISSGSFICEYIGELLTEKEAEQRIDNDDYLFDIGNHFDEDLTQRESRCLDTQSNCLEEIQGEGFAIDARKFGNVGRFINHSCSPNLYAQNVLFDHDDKRVPHIMLFAAKNIRPLMELTYDYNYKIDRVRDANGNIKKKNCYCGSRECTGRMY